MQELVICGNRGMAGVIYTGIKWTVYLLWDGGLFLYAERYRFQFFDNDKVFD